MIEFLPVQRPSRKRLTSVPGSIEVERANPLSTIAVGSLHGGCIGVRYDLVLLRDAITAALEELYSPDANLLEYGESHGDLQIVDTDTGRAILVIAGDETTHGERRCVMVAPRYDEDRITRARDAVEVE